MTQIRPVPTDAEAAAITAAVEALWPRPVAASAPDVVRRSPWRFSGRWWAVPLPVRRDRPWM
ncbi:MAG: hypothetical protein MUE78_09500 [Ilumatobacteraceae bacterium]|nr:hypothetical protein [Ilumatobacteraceae bacterium]